MYAEDTNLTVAGSSKFEIEHKYEYRPRKCALLALCKATESEHNKIRSIVFRI